MKRPTWKSFDDESGRRAWVSWLDAFFTKEQQACLAQPAEYDQEAETRLSAALDEAIRRGLTKAEREALRVGMDAQPSDSGRRRWRLLAAILRSGDVSEEFLAILADLVEYGGFHPKAAFATEDETLTTVLHQTRAVLRREYPEQSANAISRRAYDLAALFHDDQASGVEVRRTRRTLTEIGAKDYDRREERNKLRLIRSRL